MLGQADQASVSRWREKKDIILLDADSTFVSANSTLKGLASKFEREEFAGRLWFLKGGHSAVVENDIDLVITEDEDSVNDGDSGSNASESGSMRLGGLGILAFEHGELNTLRHETFFFSDTSKVRRRAYFEVAKDHLHHDWAPRFLAAVVPA